MAIKKLDNNVLLVNALTRCEEAMVPNVKLIKATMSLVKMLEVDRANRPISFLLNNERTILADEIVRNTEPEQRASLMRASKGLEECQVTLDALSRRPQGYKEDTDKAFGERQRRGGLPLDASRVFFKSHLARLENRLKGPDVEESRKILFRERKENIKAIEAGYIEMQQKALGITPPSKDKGISR